MHHPTDRIIHTMAFITPVVEHWLEENIGHGKRRVLYNFHLLDLFSNFHLGQFLEYLKCFSLQLVHSRSL